MTATVIGVLTVAIWTYLLLLRGGFWRLSDDPSPAPPPLRPASARRVVAVVPARDEADVIGRAIASLLSQDYPGPLDVVVVDDHSSDGTAAAAQVAAEALGAGERLTVVAGASLPAGWTGKLWAMRQGIAAAQALRPDYLLLTDADVVHAPDGLREMVGRCEVGGYDLVSLMVRLHCASIAERLLIPAFVFYFFQLFPPRWVADPLRRTAAAAGGCMLIRPQALERIGGIEAIRGEIIDDCALARRVKAGGRIWLGLSRQTSSIREYGSWLAIWRMIARCAFAQLGYSAALLVVVLALLGLTYLAPPLLLLSAPSAAAWLGAIAWAEMSLAFLPMLRAYEAPSFIAVLLPAISAFYAAATLASAIAFWCGRGGAWKGRFQATAAPR